MAMRNTFFHHLHPPTIPAAQARWRYTLGAGGTAIFLMLILGATGILEMFYYAPNPNDAALSVQTISYHIPFGGLIRNLHYWAGQFLMVVSAVHLLRIVFTGAYTKPRRFNYLLGLALFVILVLLNFTGYILRWDQDICWALVAGTNLLTTIPVIGDFLYRIAVGGGDACSHALLRFYTWHIFGLAMLAVILGVWHAFRVRRDGGIAIPPAPSRPDKQRISRNELVFREILGMLYIGTALILLASFVPAPIAAAITGKPTVPVEASAPWFFLWVQQMLGWGNPFFWGVLVPLLILLILALIPYVFPQPAESEQGRWLPRSNRLAQIALSMIALLVIVLSVLELLPSHGN
jgi:quinol-cytochrome oxidoreductase complex cytochrome b subunit